MARPYSMDLRERVRAAVIDGGLSCRQAATRFGVAASRRSNGCSGSGRVGVWRLAKIGGYRARAIAGADRDWPIERCRRRDFTLRGLVAELAERGLKVDYRTVWSFVHAETLSYKKSLARQRTGPTRHRPSAGAVAALPGSG
jgi:putative transposase